MKIVWILKCDKYKMVFENFKDAILIFINYLKNDKKLGLLYPRLIRK